MKPEYALIRFEIRIMILESSSKKPSKLRSFPVPVPVPVSVSVPVPVSVLVSETEPEEPTGGTRFLKNSY